MAFEPNIEKLRDIVERRFTRVDDEAKQVFPEILKLSNVHWVSFANQDVLALLFVTEEDLARVKSYQSRGLDAFPGLITTDPKLPVTFHFSHSRFGLVQRTSVTNRYSFRIGPDTSFIAIDHHQTLKTKELGLISYKVPLGYFLGLGKEITWDNVYETLEELIAYGIKLWRESHAA